MGPTRLTSRLHKPVQPSERPIHHHLGQDDASLTSHDTRHGSIQRSVTAHSEDSSWIQGKRMIRHRITLPLAYINSYGHFPSVISALIGQTLGLAHANNLPTAGYFWSILVSDVAMRLTPRSPAQSFHVSTRFSAENQPGPRLIVTTGGFQFVNGNSISTNQLPMVSRIAP